MPTTLIVGAGVFGASTAYHLSKTSPPSPTTNRIILLDRAPFPDDPLTNPPAPGPGSSWDWNKIIRADYTDPEYTPIMVDGLREWAANPVFKPWYFPTGIVWYLSKAVLNKFVAGYGDAPPEGVRMMSGREGREDCGWFPDAKLEEDQGCMFNPAGGWAMAKEAVAATVRAAVAQGVEYVTGEVVRARRETTGEDGSGVGKCVGVELADGSVVQADRVIICMGVGAVRFLEASGKDLAVGNKLRAGGFFTACVKSGLDNDKYNKVCAIEKKGYEGGGFMPAGPRSPAKIYYDLAMLYRPTLASSGNVVSAAPPGADQDMWTTTPHMLTRMRETTALFVGDEAAAKVEFEDYRMCWDLATANEDFVVSPLGNEGLYMATAGSFHGFKFLPVIGRYVVDMLEGRLDEGLAKKWHWNTDRGESWRSFGDAEKVGGFTIKEAEV